MGDQQDPLVIPVIREEAHAEARPVQTGSVRVTKTFETHEQLLEQELRKGRADVQRVPLNQVVEGPLPPRREGRTLIIPVVSEKLSDCGKQWVLTEEIRVTQIEEAETVRQSVPVREEHARVERLDADGHVVANEAPAAPHATAIPTPTPVPPVAPETDTPIPNHLRSIVSRDRQKAAGDERVLSRPQSILRKKPGA